MISILKTEDTGFGFWIDFYTFEDYYFTITELAQRNNHNRMKKFKLEVTLLKWIIIIEIPLKHVGEIRLGKVKRKKENKNV